MGNGNGKKEPARSYADAEAEQRFIGLMMRRPSDLYGTTIAEKHLSLPLHRTLFRALFDLAIETTSGVGVDQLYERARSLTASAVSASDIIACQMAAEDTVYTRELEKYLVDLHARRTLDLMAQDMRVRMQETSLDPRETFSGLMADAERDLASEDVGDVLDLDAYLADYMPTVRDRRPGSGAGLRSGFTDIDRLTGGFPRGSLSVIGARPGVGKSAFAQDIAERVAARGGCVLDITPEMSRTQVADRRISRATGIPLGALRGGWLRTEQREKLADAPYVGGTMYVLDTGAQTATRIATIASRLHLRKPLDLVLVDHLQFLMADAEVKREKRWVQVGYATRVLTMLARKLNTVVLVLSQLNRDSAKRGARPSLAELRETGDIEQDANVVLLLHRPGYYDPDDDQSKAEVIVAKARDGATGRVDLRWKGETATYLQPEDTVDDNVRDLWYNREGV